MEEIRNLWKLWNLKFFISNLVRNKKFFVLGVKNLLLLERLLKMLGRFQMDVNSQHIKSLLDKSDVSASVKNRKSHKKSLLNLNENFFKNWKGPKKRQSAKLKDAQPPALDKREVLQCLLENMSIYRTSNITFKVPRKSRKSNLKVQKSRFEGGKKSRDYHSMFVNLVLNTLKKLKYELDFHRDALRKHSLSFQAGQNHVHSKTAEFVKVLDKFLFFEKFLGR